jgi:hypothetical protein
MNNREKGLLKVSIHSKRRVHFGQRRVAENVQKVIRKRNAEGECD